MTARYKPFLRKIVYIEACIQHSPFTTAVALNPVRISLVALIPFSLDETVMKESTMRTSSIYN
jgi:hypothetical protein